MWKNLWNWLKKSSNQLSAIATIIALIFSSISLYLVFHPLPNKPILDVFSSEPQQNGVILFIHNGGTAPCVDLTVTYPNEFAQVEQILNYKNSDLRNSEYKNGSLYFPPQYWITNSGCNDAHCKIKVGYLDVNEIIPLHFTFRNETAHAHNLEVSCSNQIQTVVI
jgi:hypothetical protein